MLVSAFILLVPMVYIFVQAFSKGLMPVLHNPADPDMLHAIWLTVLIALIAVPVNPGVWRVTGPAGDPL